MSINRCLLNVMCVMVSISLFSCGSGGNGSNTSKVKPSAQLVNVLGENKSEFNSDEPVVLDVAGLVENNSFRIKIIDPDGNERNPDGGYRATTDEHGILDRLTVIQDLGVVRDLVDRVQDQSDSQTRLAKLGEYTVEVWNESGELLHSVTFKVQDNKRIYCSYANGNPNASFLPMQEVFVSFDAGSDTISDGTYPLSILSDYNAPLEDGDTIVSGQYTMTISNGTGTASVGGYPVGSYDIILDVDADNKFDVETDLISRRERLHPCFTIQQANTGNPIIGQVASDRNGNHIDIFDNTAKNGVLGVYAFIAPHEQSKIKETLGVFKFVVEHQNVWNQGDALNDVTSGIEIDPVQGFCTNEAPWLIWPRQLIKPGCYDVVIDINRNNLFDAGIDLVDNIDSFGNSSCGFYVPDPICSSTINFTDVVDGQTVTESVFTLKGSMDINTKFSWVTILSSNQVNHFRITPDQEGNFSAKLPLQNAENHITVVAIDENNNACSETITIINESQTKAKLFNINLNWQGAADIDLHFVKPSGTFDDSATDCYYSSCDSNPESSVDWGAPSEPSDNPILDIDCTGNCEPNNENIWMNNITEDGDYKIYAHAFSGVADATITVSIRGVSFAPVQCPGLDDTGTATEFCEVGTIRWLGGTNGNGTFIPSGLFVNPF